MPRGVPNQKLSPDERERMMKRHKEVMKVVGDVGPNARIHLLRLVVAPSEAMRWAEDHYGE